MIKITSQPDLTNLFYLSSILPFDSPPSRYLVGLKIIIGNNHREFFIYPSISSNFIYACSYNLQLIQILLILVSAMKNQAVVAEYSDDEEESIVEPQNGTANFSINGTKQKNKESRPVTTVTNTDKAFRLIEPGLMLEGLCLSPACIAYQKKALHIFGFVSDLNFASARYKALCRLCKQPLEDVKNIGYYKSVIKIYGKIAGKKGFINRVYRAEDDRYHTFKDGTENEEEWDFLELTTCKLDK